MQSPLSCPHASFEQARRTPSGFGRDKRARDPDPPAYQRTSADARAADLLATIADAAGTERRVRFSDAQPTPAGAPPTVADPLTTGEPPTKRARCIAGSDAAVSCCTTLPSSHYAVLGASTAGPNCDPRLLAVDCAMRLRSTDGALTVLRGTLRSFIVTRALAPLVQSETHDGALAVDASLEGLLPVVTFLGLCGSGADNWRQVAQSVTSFAALSSAATTATRCRLQKLADRLLRWRSLASQWTCPATRFTVKVVRAASAASSGDTLVVTAHAAAVAVDSFVELAQHIGQAEAGRLALDSITARRRDTAQRTVALPLARFETAVLGDEKQYHDGSGRGDTASAGDNKAELSPIDSLSWLATWRTYIDATRRPANATGSAIVAGMLGRARAAVTAVVSTPAARAELTAALDCYERLCADGTCQPDNAFHLYAILANRAAGWTCAAAGAVIFDAVARSLVALGLLLDAEAKLAPSAHRERGGRDHREHSRSAHDTTAPAPAPSRIRIERHMADLFLARLGGSFQCDHDVGTLIDEALRKHYGIS